MNDQQRAAMQMALDALENWRKGFTDLWEDADEVACDALREALCNASERMAQPQGDEKQWLDAYKRGYDQGKFDSSMEAQPQGEWVDLTWDDYLELAGQGEFYVKDPHTGAMEFCSHEFTKAAIAKFKSKNTPPVVPQGEPVGYLAEATRFKVCMTDHECMITGLPMELGGRWVALVAAEDDCHLRYTSPPSVEAAIAEAYDKGCADGIDITKAQVEAAIAETKKRAIRIVVGWTTGGPINEWNRTLEKIKQEIAAIPEGI